MKLTSKTIDARVGLDIGVIEFRDGNGIDDGDIGVVGFLEVESASTTLNGGHGENETAVFKHKELKPFIQSELRHEITRLIGFDVAMSTRTR